MQTLLSAPMRGHRQYATSAQLATLVTTLTALFAGLWTVYVKLSQFNYDPAAFADTDGMFVYILAQSLPRLYGAFDVAAYRAQRILLPLLAAPMRGNQAWALIAINLLAITAGTYALARVAQLHAMPASLGLGFGLGLGTLFALEFDLTEVLAYALVAFAIWAWERRMPAAAALLCGLAMLGKETALLYGIALVLAGSAGGWRKRARLALLAFGPGLAWQAVLMLTYGESGITAAFRNGSPAESLRPLVGLWNASMPVQGAWFLQIGWVLLPALAAIGWGAWLLLKRDPSPLPWALLLNGLFVASLPSASTEYMVHSSRIGLAVTVAFAWAVIRYKHRAYAYLWLGLMLAPLLHFEPGRYF